MKSKTITFIIPMYNQKTFIEECLMSILISSFNENELEIIVWNDGSTDGCERVVEGIAIKHPCICLINDTNHGVSYARNQALKKASGEYIWFVDSDDRVKSEEVFKLVQAAREDNSDAIIFNWNAVSEDGGIYEGIHPIIKKGIFKGRELYLKRRLNMAPWCYLYNRKFLLERNLDFPLDFKTCEDIQFNQKMLYWADRVTTLPITGYLYRENSISATKGNETRVCRDQIRRLQCELDFFLQYNDYQFLFEIVYRNLREINVWLAKCCPEEGMFRSIKDTLRKYHVPYSFSFKYMFVMMMAIRPELVYKVQNVVRHFKLMLKY